MCSVVEVGLVAAGKGDGLNKREVKQGRSTIRPWKTGHFNIDSIVSGSFELGIRSEVCEFGTGEFLAGSVRTSLRTSFSSSLSRSRILRLAGSKLEKEKGVLIHSAPVLAQKEHFGL